ncbi:hypothetical protein Tco_0181404, partial [Tanacetum coccineum]
MDRHLTKLSVKCRTGHPLASGLRLFKTYDGESFKAHEFYGKVHRDSQIRLFSNAGRTGHPLAVSGLRLFKTYDGESFKAHEFCGKGNFEVAFRKHTCFVRDIKGTDILKGSHSTNLYTISIDEMMKSSPICLL